MKIELTEGFDRYKIGDIPVRIICIDAPGEYPVIAIPEEGYMYSVDSDGRRPGILPPSPKSLRGDEQNGLVVSGVEVSRRHRPPRTDKECLTVAGRCWSARPRGCASPIRSAQNED